MESQIWHELAGFVALLGEGLEKGQGCLLALIPGTSVPPSMPLVPFKLLLRRLLLWWWSSERVSLRRWVCVGSLRGTAWGFTSFFHQISPCWFLHQKLCGLNLPGTGTLGWGTCCVIGIPCSWDIPFEFLSTTRGCGSSLFCIFALYQSGWIWFL